MPKIIEKRFFTAQDIRSLCIQKNWFTRGTNKQYDHLFSILFAHKVTNNNSNFAYQNHVATPQFGNKPSIRDSSEGRESLKF